MAECYQRFAMVYAVLASLGQLTCGQDSNALVQGDVFMRAVGVAVLTASGQVYVNDQSADDRKYRRMWMTEPGTVPPRNGQRWCQYKEQATRNTETRSQVSLRPTPGIGKAEPLSDVCYI